MPRKARDYAAEYARRKASGLRRGQTVAQARGHRNEAAEKRTRRERIRREFGTTPERLGRLRRETVAHIVRELSSSGTKGRINVETITQGVRMMTAEMMQEFALQANGAQLKEVAHYSYQAFILEYPGMENDDEHNPFWYGSKTAVYV